MPASPLLDPILAHLEHDPQRLLLVDDQGPWSRGDLHERSGQLALGLLRAGLRRGQRLLLGLPPGGRFASALLAGLRLGAPVIPISPRVTERQLAHILFDSGPRLALADEPLAASIRNLAPATRAFSPERLNAPPSATGEPDTEESIPLYAGFSGTHAREEDPCLVLYTSGTTGRPKGAVHSHGSLASNLRALEQAWEWSEGDHLLLSLPLYHLHGLVVGLLGALWAGMRVRLESRFDAATSLARLAELHCTLFYGVPTMYRRLLEQPGCRPLPAMRLFVSGSAPLPRKLAEEFEARFARPLLQRYGTTESGIALSQSPAQPVLPGCVGRPLPGVEVRLAGGAGGTSDEDGQADGVDEEGELWVKGPSLFLEYLEDEEATASAWQDEFYRTGDWVRRAAHGEYFILGRISSDVFKVRGHKVSALEIEEVLSEHPDVAEVAIVGIEQEDGEDALFAFVIPAPGSASDASLGDALEVHARQRLAPYQVPGRFLVVVDLPRTGPGKVDKQVLRRTALEAGR